MVKLVDPDPPHPAQGDEFSITADEGAPPYTFIWRIDDGDNTQKEPPGGTMTIDIPRDTAGGKLLIIVMDSAGHQDSRLWDITPTGKTPIL